MKILKDNKMYVQKNDIAYLNRSGLDIPASVFLKVFGNGITIIDNSNRYEFIEFSNPEDIKFFQGIDWIVDYNEVKELTEEELLELGQGLAKERNRRAQQFNAMSPSKRRQLYDQVTMDLELLEFKIYSIRDIIMLKRGELSFPLPSGVVIISMQSAERAEEEVVNKTDVQKRSGGIKKFVKSIFGKRKDK